MFLSQFYLRLPWRPLQDNNPKEVQIKKILNFRFLVRTVDHTFRNNSEFSEFLSFSPVWCYELIKQSNLCWIGIVVRLIQLCWNPIIFIYTFFFVEVTAFDRLFSDYYSKDVEVIDKRLGYAAIGPGHFIWLSSI